MCLDGEPFVPLAACSAHPVQIVAKAEQDWLPRWKCPPALLRAKHVAALKCFLNDRDQRPVSSLDVHFCGKTLRSICKEMACKASGPDAWSAGDLWRLPEVWWEAFALLCTSVYKSGAIPCRWLEARVCLLPKANGSSRPLSILSVSWRIGARYITRELEHWLATWVDFRCVGGVPKGSVQSAHARSVQAMRDSSLM